MGTHAIMRPEWLQGALAEALSINDKIAKKMRLQWIFDLYKNR
jgi:hypothetical protein